MPQRTCLWCGDGRLRKVRGGYRCPECGQPHPLPNRPRPHN